MEIDWVVAMAVVKDWMMVDPMDKKWVGETVFRTDMMKAACLVDSSVVMTVATRVNL